MDWLGMLEEFRSSILIELDHVQEAQHVEIFRKHSARRPDVYVPRLHPELSTARVLVTAYIAGLKMTETAQLKAAGHDPQRVVTRLVRTYLKQLLEDGFFHVDPNPGNLRVMADRLSNLELNLLGRIVREADGRNEVELSLQPLDVLLALHDQVLEEFPCAGIAVL
jgi:predicted unusual protein kinase regulating ubiquinone biosynthesis (AarF/ABC1/UbiB family)